MTDSLAHILEKVQDKNVKATEIENILRIDHHSLFARAMQTDQN